MKYMRLTLGLLAPLILGTGTALAGSNSRSYSNAGHAYSIPYPSDWSRLAGTQPVDVGFLAPDRNAEVLVLAPPADANGSATLRAYLPALFQALGTVEGYPALRRQTVAGVQAQVATIQYRSAHNTQGGALLVFAPHGRRLYLLVGMVDDVELPSAGRDTRAVIDILKGVKFR